MNKNTNLAYEVVNHSRNNPNQHPKRDDEVRSFGPIHLLRERPSHSLAVQALNELAAPDVTSRRAEQDFLSGVDDRYHNDWRGYESFMAREILGLRCTVIDDCPDECTPYLCQEHDSWWNLEVLT